MTRGHSNVKIEYISRWDTPPDCAKLPLVGGAKVWTCKELPPLALHKGEWEAIGRYMGWLPSGTELLDTLRGLLTYVEDGNVVELHECGFVEEIRTAIAKAEGRQL